MRYSALSAGGIHSSHIFCRPRVLHMCVVGGKGLIDCKRQCVAGRPQSILLLVHDACTHKRPADQLVSMKIGVI